MISFFFKWKLWNLLLNHGETPNVFLEGNIMKASKYQVPGFSHCSLPVFASISGSTGRIQVMLTETVL